MTEPRHTKFYLDKKNKQWAGVCSGIADYTGVDVTFVRVGFVLLTVMGGFPWTLVAYWIIAHVTPDKPRELKQEAKEKTKFWQGVRTAPRRTIRDVRSRFRDVDRRLADVETYITSSHSKLAQEIEQLR